MGLRLETYRFDQTGAGEILGACAHAASRGHFLHAKLRPVAVSRKTDLLGNSINHVGIRLTPGKGVLETKGGAQESLHAWPVVIPGYQAVSASGKFRSSTEVRIV